MSTDVCYLHFNVMQGSWALAKIKKKIGNQLWAQRIYEHAGQQSRVKADESARMKF